MAENKLTASTGNVLEVLPEPTTIEDLPKAFPNKLKWHESLNLDFGYDAIPVFVHAMFKKDGHDMIKFSLVRCDTPEEPKLTDETFTIPIDDYNVCHSKVPSTVRDNLQFDGAELKKQKRIVFLMLHPKKMPLSEPGKKLYEDVANAASSPVSDRGKWPMTTASTLARSVNMINRLREEARGALPITPERIDELRREFDVPLVWPMPPMPRDS